ncbi:hypothetical protein PTR91_16140 [Serratia bockelmannii]|uniref:hypothetical protein n=1 Tax=Serratia TaxID=613 RepID=UPI0013DB88F3|nr:hypothetical protein [Serratia marcescens]
MKNTSVRQYKATAALASAKALAERENTLAAGNNKPGTSCVPRLSEELAQQAVIAALLACRKDGWKITVSVVNPMEYCRLPCATKISAHIHCPSANQRLSR